MAPFEHDRQKHADDDVQRDVDHCPDDRLHEQPPEIVRSVSGENVAVIGMPTSCQSRKLRNDMSENESSTL